jgi:hypothetical protein
MVLSKFESAKCSTMKSQSRIRTKLQAKSTIRAKILDKSAIRCINKIRKSEIRTIFSVKSDDPKTYSPPPPPVWHYSLPSFLNDQVEHIQRHSTKVICPSLSYSQSLTERTRTTYTLFDRRESLCKSSFYTSNLNTK